MAQEPSGAEGDEDNQAEWWLMPAVNYEPASGPIRSTKSTERSRFAKLHSP